LFLSITDEKFVDEITKSYIYFYNMMNILYLMKNKIITSILPIVFSIMVLAIIGNSIHNAVLAQSSSNDTSTNQTGKQQQQERLQLQERQHQLGQETNQTTGTLGGQQQQERLQLQERQHQPEQGNQSLGP
jgi:hypothetical protein